MKIATLGLKGSFHSIAATKYFGENIVIKELFNFRDVVKSLRSDSVDYAVMAVENTNLGLVLSNYKLIDELNLNIKAEIYISMKNHLMALKGQKISDIKEIWSHPLLIRNSDKFTRHYPNVKVFETRDTAEGAKKIATNKIKGVAAIASRKSAEIYGLKVFEDIVLSDEENYTRFLILNKFRDFYQDDIKNNKSSIKLIVKEQSFSLGQVLNITEENGLKLTKIHSFTLDKEPLSKGFYIDFYFTDYQKYCKALLLLEEKVEVIKVMGEYEEATI